MITYGSVCSGIEAASVAWEPLGMRAAWLSEIEPFPSAVLSHHWPHVTNLGDMTNLAACLRAGMIPPPEVLVGGTPCQAFSVAGLRGGMADARGQLTLTYVDILNAIDEKRPTGDEAVCVWENVPGVLSSKDNAFGCFLATLVGEDVPLEPAGKRWTNSGVVFGPQRTAAWRILDAQYFGVAQRRRRVFVVASARDGFDPCAVLFESEGVRRDTPPSRETEKAVAATATGDTGAGGAERLIPFNQQRTGQYSDEDIASTCAARDYKSATDLVAIRTAQTSSNGCGITPNGPAYTLDGTQGQAVSTASTVRRLTPVECERLQGFPDNHTQIPWRGKDAENCPDGPRYKAIGNSKAVPVVRWIGKRLLKLLIPSNSLI